jgi:ectoine hydroxylase-related dioxygenase (phytanoyl-CoA dioxygenase family)
MARDAERAHYRDDGFVIIRGLVDRGIASRWKRILRGHFDHAGSTTGVHVVMPEELPPEILDACLEGPLAETAQDVTGEALEFLSAKPVFKSREVRFASPWHQDAAYWRGCRKVSAWIALEPAGVANGCLRVIPGLHHDFLEHDAFRTPQGFDNRLAEEKLPVTSAVDVVLDTGDVAFFSDHLPHGSHPNLSGRDRWSLIPTWRPAGGVEVSGIWKTPIKLRVPFRRNDPRRP